ncbi:unnamed protein product [Rotaria sordida]|uniref:Ubiquitin-like domain-containing protein n=1 Tax=Rotaria sordida TaxID=392033 RepID=A0A813YCU6_9BILA|nr:unnamed protein product [Rotaria sordida]CAF0882480.1 unnamed protein product [Rotaria sordida]CAF0883443.1 unnamed protein product [Rotaria sordida]CAF0898798.1 unnamed protein product [Rotaria sordida]CAF0900664.1 unnamed protein product [Rotaria sordida]
MNDQTFRKTPLPPTRVTGNHMYTKLQVHYGGDVHDLVLKTEKEPTCQDLGKALEDAFRVSINDQLIYYRGQRLHHQQSLSDDRPLSRYGIFPGNSVTLIGKRGLL